MYPSAIYIEPDHSQQNNKAERRIQSFDRHGSMNRFTSNKGQSTLWAPTDAMERRLVMQMKSNVSRHVARRKLNGAIIIEQVKGDTPDIVHSSEVCF